MKHLRRLLPALCLLLISAMCAGTSTYAWFSLNQRVTATGMKVRAIATGSLVIKDEAIPTEDDEEYSVPYEDDEDLKPATHIVSPDTFSTYASGLKYVNNPVDVSSASGAALEGKTLTWSPATEGTYYVEHTMFIAVQGNEALGALTVKFKEGFSIPADDTLKACSIDVYAKAVDDVDDMIENAETFKGTFHMDTADHLAQTFNLADSVPTVGNGAIAVTIRIYFDGALEGSDGNMLVRSSVISEGDVTVALQFDAANA